MRPLRLLPLLCFLACATQDAPPGEPIGTFSFVATLDPTEPGEGESPLCPFAGAPARIAFDGSLSHDRETGEAWLLVDGTLREGELDGAVFSVGLPAEEDGSIRAVPRRLAACTCDLLFLEEIEGQLLSSASGGCAPPLPEPGPPDAESCPRLDEEGALSWDTCGGACGTLREEIRFVGPGCICEVDGVEQPAPERCQFRWSLQGTRIGG